MNLCFKCFKVNDKIISLLLKIQKTVCYTLKHWKVCQSFLKTIFWPLYLDDYFIKTKYKSNKYFIFLLYQKKSFTTG